MRELIAEIFKRCRANCSSDLCRSLLELDHSGFRVLQIKTSDPGKKNSRFRFRREKTGSVWNGRIRREGIVCTSFCFSFSSIGDPIFSQNCVSIFRKWKIVCAFSSFFSRSLWILVLQKHIYIGLDSDSIETAIIWGFLFFAPATVSFFSDSYFIFSLLNDR